MKNKINTLHQYIYNNSLKEYHKETVNGLFRMILEPVISNQKFDCCLLFRLLDTKDKKSILKRLAFSNASIYSFSEKLNELNIENSQNEDIWEQTEFVIILGHRYSAALIWDYSISDKKDYSHVCVFYNSKIVSDIAKKINENSRVNFKDLILKYNPDRRENLILNEAIKNIISLLNEKNEEIIFNELEKKQLINSDDTVKTANIVAQKAKFVAHEIRNSLSVIDLYLKILEKRLINIEFSKDKKESIDNSIFAMRNSAENISSLINDLRCLSVPYITKIELKEFICNTVKLCIEKANSSNVNIKINDMENIEIYTDKVKLQCTLINIIYNAIEACNSDCNILIDLFVEHNVIKILIKNNGKKISEEEKDKIFEVNYTTKPKGSGLGLAICKQQLALIGGNINLVSSDDNETVFSVILPVKFQKIICENA